MLKPEDVGPEHAFTANGAQQLGGQAGGLKAWHDENVGGAGKPAERIILALIVVVQRHIRRHFAFIFEIDVETVEKLHRLAQAFDMHSGGVAEGRVADEGNPRV